jgi:hypothetical protein
MDRKLLSLCLVVPVLFCCNSSDKKAWKTAQAKASISSFESYLLGYPKGSMKVEAIAKIEELYFKEAEQLNSITALDNFVMRYPHGRWSDKARIETETLRLKKAQAINAIPAYQEFINRYPEGPMSDIAKQKREDLFNNRHPDFKGTKTARILIEESFAVSFSSKYQDTYSRIKEIAVKLCEMAGLQVAGANDDNYDITLKIQLRWTPLSAQYAPKGGNRLFSSTIYTGAHVQGGVSLITPQNVVHKKNIEGLLSPPEETVLNDSDPSRAPLVEALDKYVEPKMIELMRDDYGLDDLPPYIVPALE